MQQAGLKKLTIKGLFGVSPEYNASNDAALSGASAEALEEQIVPAYHVSVSGGDPGSASASDVVLESGPQGLSMEKLKKRCLRPIYLPRMK